MNAIRSFMEGTYESIETGLGVDGTDIVAVLMIFFGIIMGIITIYYIAYEIKKVENARTKMNENDFKLFMFWCTVTVGAMIGLVLIVFSLDVYIGYGGRGLAILWIIPLLAARKYLHQWSKKHSPENTHKDFGDVQI